MLALLIVQRAQGVLMCLLQKALELSEDQKRDLMTARRFCLTSMSTLMHERVQLFASLQVGACLPAAPACARLQRVVCAGSLQMPPLGRPPLHCSFLQLHDPCRRAGGPSAIPCALPCHAMHCYQPLHSCQPNGSQFS